MGVLVAGSSVLDIHVDVDEAGAFDQGWASDNVTFLERPPAVVLGGNGAATAYALGRLGVATTLNTTIGVDTAGDVITGWLDEANVTLASPRQGATPVNVVRARATDGARSSAFFTGRKLDWSVGLDRVDDGWFFASGYGRVDADDFAPLVDAFSAARSRGARVAFDPGPWFARSVPVDAMRAALEGLDGLFGTEEELRAWSDAETAADLIDDYTASGVGLVVVKRGREGASFGVRDGARGEVAGNPIEGAHAVGAGDTFNGTLLAGLVKGSEPGAAIEEAVGRAERAVASRRGVLGAFNPA